jgi:hypothetical protein
MRICPERVAATACKSASISPVDWYRSAGAFAMARATMRAQAAGIAGLAERGSGIDPWQCAYMSCGTLSDSWYGCLPVSRQ